jgi:predicted house-cleaning noncanonical NTP pyrophosphatase (MazG superfamily)
MIVYNKLVRDRIPEVIAASGKRCEVRVLDDQEYMLRLNQKLQEEM